MNDTTRDELMEKVSDVIWQGMLPGHEHVSQLREPANATARHIIALVTEARDAEIRAAYAEVGRYAEKVLGEIGLHGDETGGQG